ncbi:MAG: Gfo/Idh/MocA family oxidoreductase [Planctomycetota bacterium]
MAEKVRVGVVGCGHNGQAFMKCYKECHLSALAAICDLSEERLKVAGDQFSVARRYTNIDEMLEKEDLDCVSVNTSDPFHRDPFVKAIEAGKHVFVEKPFGNTVEDVEAMVAAARKSNAKTLVGHILRFNPYFAKIKDLSDTGALGEIFYMEADYIHNLFGQGKPERFNPAIGMNWYLDREIPIVGGGVHQLDLLRWYCGSNVVEVAGYGNSIAFPDMKNPDCQSAVFKMESGAVAKVAALYGPVGPRPEHCNMAVYGTKGTVRGGKLYLGAGHDAGEQDLSGLAVSGHPYMPEVEHFMDCILNDKPTLTDAFDGANSAIACILAAEAIRTREKKRAPIYRR